MLHQSLIWKQKFKKQYFIVLFLSRVIPYLFVGYPKISHTSILEKGPSLCCNMGRVSHSVEDLFAHDSRS